jgi:hypothetical protein
MLKTILLLALLAILTAVGATSLAFISIKSEAAPQHPPPALATSHLHQLQGDLALP